MDPALLNEIQAGLERREQAFRDVLACMEENGWPVAVSGKESFSVVGETEEQRPLVAEVYRTCSESTGWSGPTDVDPRALAQLYSYELATRDCLSGLGLPVDTPPSKETFIEQFTTSDRWDAYSGFIDDFAELEEQGKAPSWDEVTTACPPPIRYADLG